MRRLAVTTFAILYGLLVISAAAERFSEWVAQEAPAQSHFAVGQHFSSFLKADKSDPVRSKRILGRPFVLESPLEGVGVAIVAIRHVPLPSFEYEAAWDNPTVSPRAPPFQC
jgi:hypothetical protein